MPLNPRPLHGADHPRPAAGALRDGFQDWSRHAGAPATGPAPASAHASASRTDLPHFDASHPLLKVAAVAFVGYTLGRLVHRGPASAAPATSAPPHRPTRTAATAYLRPPEREPRSSIRFRYPFSMSAGSSRPG